MTTGNEVRALKGQPVWDVTFSPDGHWLASAAYKGAITIWDMTGSEVRTLSGDTVNVNALAFSRDSKWLASEGYFGTVKIWDTALWREMQTLAGNGANGENVAFSPDARWLASTSEDNGDETIKIWDVGTGRDVRTLNGHSSVFAGLEFSPDGRWLAFSGTPNTGEERRGTIIFWDVATWSAVRTLILPDGVPSIAFSPDGRWLASACWDGTVRIWDVTAGVEVRRLNGHGDRVVRVAFSPDGNWLASENNVDGQPNNIVLWRRE